jgi:hypothetical protein
MATQQIKCISSQYEEYRNQMKRSRKSEEYRNKRNQQMAQAQKLLDSNLPSEKRTHNSGEKLLNKKWNEEQQNQLQRYKERNSEFRKNKDEEKCQMSYEKNSESNESCKSALDNDLEKLTESDLPICFKDSLYLSTSDVRFVIVYFFDLENKILNYPNIDLYVPSVQSSANSRIA